MFKGKHFYENATENCVSADVISMTDNYLKHEDMKASQGMNICTQVGDLKGLKKDFVGEDAGFYCVLKMIPDCIITKKDPISLFVDVVEGTVKIGTPLCIPSRGFIYIGKIVSIWKCNKLVDCASKGDSVEIEVVCEAEEQPKILCRQAKQEDLLVSCNGRGA